MINAVPASCVPVCVVCISKFSLTLKEMYRIIIWGDDDKATGWSRILQYLSDTEEDLLIEKALFTVDDDDDDDEETEALLRNLAAPGPDLLSLYVSPFFISECGSRVSNSWDCWLFSFFV